MVATGETQGRAADLLWRLLALAGAFAVLFAVATPWDVDGLGPVLIRWFGAIVLATVVYSFLASLRR